MLEQFFSFGIRQLFGGARRGQPMIAAFGAAITIWGVLRSLDGRDKPVYTRKMRDGEMIQIKMIRGQTSVESAEPE
jgi:hypothetical protein